MTFFAHIDKVLNKTRIEHNDQWISTDIIRPEIEFILFRMELHSHNRITPSLITINKLIALVILSSTSDSQILTDHFAFLEHPYTDPEMMIES